MKKSRLFSLFTTLLAGSMIASTSVAFFDNQNLNISKISNNTQANQYTSTVNEDNLDVGSVSFIQDTSQNKTSTPYGFLKYDASKKTIYSISYFGFIGWKYNLANSAFLKRGSITQPTNVYMYYIPDLDRIVVYGDDSSKSFLFQLNAKDGSEYYVNEEDKTAQGSSLIQGSDTNMIGDLGQISYMGDKTIVLLPKVMSTSNKTISTYKINLESYIGSPLVFDYNSFNFQTTTNDSGGTNQLTTSHSVKNIIGYIDTGTQNILLVSSIGTTNGTKTAGVLAIIFNEDLKFSQGLYIAFLSNADINGINDNDIFNKSFYDFTIEKNDSNKISRIFIIMKEIKALDSFGSYNVGALQLSSSQKALARNNNTNSIATKEGIQNKSIVNDIFYNSKDKKTYVLVRDDVGNEKKAYGFYDATKIGTHQFTYPININFDSDVSNNFAIKPVIYNFDLTTSGKKLPFIYSYNGFSSNGTWSKQNVGSLKITTKGNENSFDTSFENDFGPTKISSFKDKIEEKYSYYLPQDINQNILNEHIYLQKVDNDSRLYNSTIVIPQNGLKPNNENGTLTGTVNLNLTKWWLYGDKTNNTESIPININLSNLGTNAGLNFLIVLNANINQEKYNKILEFQKTKYPSEITDEEILNYFLQYGNKIKLTTNDIKFVREGNLVGGNSSDTLATSSNSKAITVTTNDDNGTIKIDYDLNGKTSPSALNKTGTGTFTNFKQLNTWQKISWNEAKLINLRKSKMIFQITKKDIIDSLNLSSSYSRDESMWTWTPTNSETNNKSKYIDDNLKGILSGTISYDRKNGGTPSTVDESFTTLSIGESNQGQGFVKLVDSIGGTNDKSVLYNAEKATQVASIYSASEAQKKILEIFGQSVTFFNSWTTVNSLNLGTPTVSGNTITYNVQFNSSITTNFEKANGEKLVLDSDWISSINSSSDVLKFNRSFSFNFNQTTYEWNYGIPITDTQYGISDIKVTTNSVITGNDLDHFKSLTPTVFTNIYKNNDDGDYLSFQDRFNLLKVNKDIDPSSIDYFVIKDIQLVPNDEKGTVYVQYEINYPNISNTSLGGETVFPQITLTGFKTLNDQIHQYLIWIIVMAAIIVLMGSSFGGYVYWNKKRNHRDKQKYNRAKKRISLLEAQTHVNDFNPLKRSKNIRNTLHSHTLKNAKIRQYEQAMKDYKQKIKELEEIDNSKRKK